MSRQFACFAESIAHPQRQINFIQKNISDIFIYQNIFRIFIFAKIRVFVIDNFALSSCFSCCRLFEGSSSEQSSIIQINS